MHVEESPLDFEIREVIDSEAETKHWRYSAEIKTPTGLYPALKVVTIDIVRDFELHSMEDQIIRLAISPGQYARYIYPDKDMLEIVLTKEPVSYKTNDLDMEESAPIITVYTAIMTEEVRPMILENNTAVSDTEQILDLSNILEIDFQIKTKLEEELQAINVGGNYRNTTVEKLLRGLIMLFAQYVEVADDQKLIGVDMTEGSNNTFLPQVSIPQGTALTDLADYIQNKTEGVYATGLSSYIHNRHWYLYPVYNTKRFDTEEEKFLIINVPAQRFPQIERTYLKKGKLTKVLATGDFSFTSRKESRQRLEGNGVMFTEAKDMMTDFAVVKGNKAVANRAKNNHQFLSEERRSGKNVVRQGAVTLTSNPFMYYSDLARRQGHYLSLLWENADDDEIKPGKPVKLLSLRDNEVIEMDGVVIKAHTQIKLKGIGMVGNSYSTHIALVVFIKLPDDAIRTGLE